MPRNSMKTVSAALLVLTALLLAGCATGNTGTTAAPAPSATAEQTKPASEKRNFAEQAAKGELGVTVIKVIDPRTFVVGPSTFEQEHNDLSGEITVKIRAGSDLVTPAEGECGYDEALAFAQQYFTENPEHAYIRAGDFGSDRYYQEIIRAGFAYIPNVQPPLLNAQGQAEGNQVGLWSTCPGFGA